MKLSGPVHTKDIITHESELYYSLAFVARENADRMQELGYKGDIDEYRKSRLKTYALWKKLHLTPNVDYISVPEGESSSRDFVSQRIFNWFAGIVRKNDAADILDITRQTLNKLIREGYLNTGLMPGNKTKYIYSTSLEDPKLLKRIDRGMQLANYKERTTVPKFGKPKKPKVEEPPASIDEVVKVTKHVNFNRVPIEEHLRLVEVVVEDYRKADPLYLDYLERMLGSYKEGRNAYTQPEKYFFAILEHVNMQDVEAVTYSLMKFLSGEKLRAKEGKQLTGFFKLINVRLRSRLNEQPEV